MGQLGAQLGDLVMEVVAHGMLLGLDDEGSERVSEEGVRDRAATGGAGAWGNRNAQHFGGTMRP